MISGDGYIGIYLNDHLAAAAGGLALARRCQRSNKDSPLGSMLSELIGELERDKELLGSVLLAHGIRRSRLKQAGAVAFERVGRLKPNGSVVRYSPLSRLIELEGLRSGIMAKRGMWEALLAIEGLAPSPEPIQAAIERADSQLARVEEARRAAAVTALASEAQPSGVT